MIRLILAFCIAAPAADPADDDAIGRVRAFNAIVAIKVAH